MIPRSESITARDNSIDESMNSERLELNETLRFKLVQHIICSKDGNLYTIGAMVKDNDFIKTKDQVENSESVNLIGEFEVNLNYENVL